MSPQNISIRTLRTYTYRPLTPSSTTTNTPSTTAASSPIERSTPIKGFKPTSRIERKPRRSVRNMAWPSKQCHKSTSPTSNPATTQLSAGLESYLLLLEQQRDQAASRCSRAVTPESVVG